MAAHGQVGLRGEQVRVERRDFAGEADAQFGGCDVYWCKEEYAERSVE
jgi:hypothetical protein